ncbi:MAG: PorV/PorQ family protein [candidate division Zixibacteria bacterium]|nr:PorV/PorQ family protein [candidate division Zixibacteria bacterium]
MKKFLVFILLAHLACFAGEVQSAEFDNLGTSGAQFLKLDVDARVVGLGGANAAITRGAMALYYNPAGIANMDENSLAFSYTDWIADIKYNYLAYQTPISGVGNVGVHVAVLTMDDMERTTLEQPEGTGEMFGANSWVVGISNAHQLTDRFSFGVTVKYIREKISELSSGSVAFDVGTIYYTGFRTLRIAMSTRNFGTDSKFGGTELETTYDQDDDPTTAPLEIRLNTQSDPLPLSFRFGLAYDFEFDEDNKLMAALDGYNTRDRGQQGSVGFEYSWRDQLALRVGYKIRADEESIAFGGGYDFEISGFGNLGINYAWADLGRLENAHRFSLTTTF